MGCVQSSQTRRSARAKQARRQKLYEQQNFHPKPTAKSSSNSSPVKVNEDAQDAAFRDSGKTTSALQKGRVASPSSPQSSGNANSGNNSSSNNEEIQFRRQHFDRNSMLRHSKKRRKSSASNTASPNVTANLNHSVPGGATPNRLKFEESSDVVMKKGGAITQSSASQVLSSTPSKAIGAGNRTTVGAAPSSANNTTASSLTSATAKNEDSKQRIPNSTSPEHLQRQNSGRLI